VVQLLRHAGDEVSQVTGGTMPATPRRAHPLAPLGRVFFRGRDVILPAVLLGLAAFATTAQPFGGPRIDRICMIVGMALALAGQALRAVVIGLVYIQRGGKNRRIHADTLVETGFFAHCRNPLYVGNMLIQIGLLCILNAPLGYAIGVPFVCLVYVAIVAAEESSWRRASVLRTPIIAGACRASCRAWQVSGRRSPKRSSNGGVWSARSTARPQRG
jgi:protein-S-isoprenylcysteine O-methyltransferase Ste14